MYIEFIGASGAGKTTIVGEAVSVLNAEKISCITRQTFFSPSQKRNYKIVWTISHLWRLDSRIASYLWKWARAKSFTNTVLKAHEYIKLRQVLSGLPATTVGLWDSGFVQLFSKLTVSGFISKEVAFTLIQKRVPKDCVLVFLDTSITEAMERKRGRAREWGSLRAMNKLETDMADEEIMKNTSAIQDMQKYMLKALEASQTTVATLDGMVSPQENAGRLVQIIKKQIHG